ncbi:MAG: CDP-alcohol phosphatidyltransferase family protein [Oscillospiraceae bacterium]|nr:CDP-alcohol phosphatidyltransferase family protein [Oscillospiraceae bacterium]
MKFIPNIISVFRICLVPVFIVVYFSDDTDNNLYAVLIYALAAFSDFLDGFLARKFEVSSNLGKVLDPLGDKLMTISVMVCITIDGLIPLWAVLLAGLKELLMGAGGLVLHKKAHVELPPSNLIGKTSTVVFFLVCVTLMLFRKLSEWASILLISVAIGLTFVALVSYLIKYVRIMKNMESADETAKRKVNN